MNHALNEEQVTELKTTWAVDEIIYATDEVAKAWSQIEPSPKLPTKPIEAVQDFLKDAAPGDVVLIQGEMGATFAIVDWLLNKGMVPIHACSKRDTIEKDGVKTSVFKHVCFRKYRRLILA